MATQLLPQLMELGHDRRKIRQLLAIYSDLFVRAWRVEGNLEQMEPFPTFDIERLEAIAATRPGYAWLLQKTSGKAPVMHPGDEPPFLAILNVSLLALQLLASAQAGEREVRGQDHPRPLQQGAVPWDLSWW